MKNLTVFFSTLLLLTGMILAQPSSQVIGPPDIPAFLGYVPGELVVKFSISNDKIEGAKTSRGSFSVGVNTLDAIAEKFQVAEMEQLFRGAKPTTIGGRVHDLSKHYIVRFDLNADLDEVAEAYRNDPNVESVEKNGIHSLFASPNDGYFSHQWYHEQANDHDIDATAAWDIQTGSTSIIVADLDSGTRYYHPDLGGANASVSNPGASRGNMWVNNAELNGSAGVDDDGNGYVDDWIGWDFIDGVTNCWTGEDCSTEDNDPRDFNGHGTHTAGIVGMITNDGYGMAGIAGGWGNGSQAEYGNGVKVMALRMGHSYNYNGQEYGVVIMSAAASAFYYAANNGAKIATCSWGSSNSGGIAAAADYFVSNGGLIFVASGNAGNTTAGYLNTRSDCISVSATDTLDHAADFTTYGSWVDICAPGTGIYSTYHDHSDANTIYWSALSGTSMACPLTAGTAALIWSQNPGWTATQVRDQLFSSTDNIDASLDSKYIGNMGAGRLNAYAAVNTGPPPAPVAAFSGSPTSGTEPLNVSFTDQSTGSITSWSWTFGDGGTSTTQNPSHQYTSDGNYTVTLTVTGPGGSDAETKTNYITVNPCTNPVAGFSGSPTSGDYNLVVSFTNSSTGATSYSWNFGDGGSSTATSPSHTYTAAGTYTVTLTATNSCGSDDEVKTDYITVTTPPCDPPVANFSGSPTSGTYPLNVSFSDLSTNSPTSWSWTFGDGGTSTVQNPSHNYTAAGTYTVALTATNSCGNDVETKTDYITVTAPSADYASLPYSTGFESGSFDQYWFTQSSNTNGAIEITTAYTPRGTYNLAMDAITNGTYVQNEAWLKLDLAGKSDVDLTFYWKEHSDEDHTQDGVYISDNGGSSFVKVYNLTGGSATYQQISLDIDALAASNSLSLTGTFVVKFQQYDNYGLTTDGMTFDDINVISNEVAPVAAFTGTPTTGNAPLAVSFTDASSGAPTSWSWSFGDGGTSTVQNPSHNYTTSGTYTVTLTATNAFGSDGETKTDYITVTDPSADYASLPYSTGFESGSFDQYWFTQSSNTNGAIEITTAYTPRGTYNLAMDAITNGTYVQNEAWLKLDLTGKSDVDLTFYWKEHSDEDHTQDGVYLSDNGGSSFVKVYNLTGGSTTYQQISLDIDALAASNSLSLTGTFVVKFQQYDNYGLTTDGMTFDDINVISNEVPPVAAFSGTPISGSAPLAVTFTDASSGSPTSWSWNFGDGGTSTVQNPSHSYAANGTYTVTLTATNAFGSDGETKTDYISVVENTGYASVPYSTGFESGSFDQYWFTQSSNTNGAIEITTAYTPRGTYNLAMDAITNGTYVQNEAWLKLNLAGLSTVDLTFYWKEHSDETHTQDGVYLSDNGGSSFVKVYNLTGGSSTYQQISLDIDALAASNSLSLTGTFVVKFQQYDNYGLTTDGMTFDDISVTGSTVSGFASVTSIPDVFSVSQNYPNPFNPVTSIDFSLPEASQVKIVVFNVLGQTISTLTDRYYEAGTHNVVWDGGTHASGIYLYRIQAGTNIETKKMLLLK